MQVLLHLNYKLFELGGRSVIKIAPATCKTVERFGGEILFFLDAECRAGGWVFALDIGWG